MVRDVGLLTVRCKHHTPGTSSNRNRLDHGVGTQIEDRDVVRATVGNIGKAADGGTACATESRPQGSADQARRGRVSLMVSKEVLATPEGQALACLRWARARPSENMLRHYLVNDHQACPIPPSPITQASRRS